MLQPIVGSKCAYNEDTGKVERCPTGLPPWVVGKCKPGASCYSNPRGSSYRNPVTVSDPWVLIQ